MTQADRPSIESIRDRIIGGIIGLLVGDALGVPVEFQARDRLRSHPVTDMRGHGTHNQPAGTWSDDSSLALATMVSLLDGYDPERIMSGFGRWWSEGYWAAHGVVFDIGGTTSAAIQRFHMKRPRTEWGGQGSSDNGNGSLMRILPLSLYVSGCETREIVEKSFEISALTHAHIRSCLCCAYYSLVVRGLLQGDPLLSAMATASSELAPYVPDDEREVLSRVLNGSVVQERQEAIRGSGYVLHCLEASLWCAARHDNYADAVLAAVNLGEDTDTTAAVTGGIAGIQHGLAGIREDWRGAVARADEVMDLARKFADTVMAMSR